MNRVYQITPTNNDSATVCLYYLDEDFNSFSADAFVMGWDVIDTNEQSMYYQST
ncbi:MAG: hypothetical protein R2831_00645 [Chitinophagaceae bacterium]